MLNPLPPENAAEFLLRSGVVARRPVVHGELSDAGHRLKDAFHGMNSIFQLPVIVVGCFEGSSQPCNEPVVPPLKPGNRPQHAVIGRRFEHIDDIGWSEGKVTIPGGDEVQGQGHGVWHPSWRRGVLHYSSHFSHSDVRRAISSHLSKSPITATDVAPHASTSRA